MVPGREVVVIESMLQILCKLDPVTNVPSSLK